LQPLDENRGFGPVRQLHAGLIHDLAGEGTEAEAAYRQALSDAQRAPFRLVQALGNFLERSGRRDEAREAYRSYLGEGRDAELLTPALTRLDRGEKPPPAVPDARAGAAEALFDLASLFNQSDTVDLAVIYARLSLALRPDFPLAQILLADLLEGQRRPAEALAIYRSVDASSPLAWNARLRAASLMESAGQGDAATTVLRQMADERPDRPDALIQLADTLRAKEKFAEAVPVYDAAVARIDASDSRYWSLFYSRAIALERSKQWGRAEGDLKRALELQPDQPYVLNYLGYSWVEQGMNLADALQLIQRAVQLRPNDGYVVDSLGWVFYRLGDVPKAVVQLERAVELRPQDPTINDHLGDAYWQSGRRDEARFQWQRALALKPDDDQVRAIEAKIAKGMDKLVPLSGASISGSGATQPASKGLGGPTSSGPTPSGPAASDPAPADPIGPAPRL
jgi:Flp pilus assembly protein TadD